MLAYGVLREIRRTDSSLNKLLWAADSHALDGRVNGEYYGNGLSVDRVYSPYSGRLQAVQSGVSTDPTRAQNLSYKYDVIGNVTERKDTKQERNEEFTSDGLSRLVSWKVKNLAEVVQASYSAGYDAIGNLTSKSDVGNYSYSGKTAAVTGISGGPLGPQTFSYDDAGNMSSGLGRTYTWTLNHKLRRVSSGSVWAEFNFDHTGQRVMQKNSRGETTYYLGSYEEVVTASGKERKYYINAPTGRVGVQIESDFGSLSEIRYFHSDGLGSINAVSDKNGKIIQRFSYDPWGKRTITPTTAVSTSSNNLGFTRGFTDHEHLDDFGLIHMNGRVYDPTLGRFLSADPNVDGAYDSQGYSRYSYVGNNPLNHTDPSGYFKLKDALKIVAVVAVGIITAGAALYAYAATFTVGFSSFGAALGAIGSGSFLTIGEAIVAGAAGGFASGFAGSLLNGGSIGDAFKSGLVGGLVGGVTAGLTFGIGNMAGENSWNWGETALAHGAVQGAATEATGGQFRHGFYAGFASSALSPQIEAVSSYRPVQAVAAAVVGGTASALGGGKFANGAVSGAFTYLFNWASHGVNVHDIANRRVLAGDLSKEQLDILNAATIYADKDQLVENQFKHAMRNLDANQTVDEARALANEFVRYQFARAWDLMDQGLYGEALFEYGLALHTLQDSTSPSHAGFQGWRSAYNSKPALHSEVRAHARAEVAYPGNQSALANATRTSFNWLVDRQLPRGDLFIFGHD